jgi:hypothetical protein
MTKPLEYLGLPDAHIDPEEAALFERYPVRRPYNPNRKFKQLPDGHLVEIMSAVAFDALQACLQNGEERTGQASVETA